MRTLVIANLKRITDNVNEPDQLFLFQNLKSIFQSIEAKKECFLEMIKEIGNATIEIKNSKVFEAYIAFVKYLSSINNEAASQYASLMNNSLKTDVYRSANNLLTTILRKMTKATITTEDFKELRDMYKKLKIDTDVLSITRILVLFMRKIELELTSQCFISFHTLVYDLLHVVSKNKDKDGIFSCCSDIKRHEIHSLIMCVLMQAEKMVRSKIFSSKEAKVVDFYINYSHQICREINCTKKQSTIKSSFDLIFKFIYALLKTDDKFILELIKEISKTFTKCIDHFEMLDEKCENVQNSITTLLDFTGRLPHDENQASFIANCCTQLLAFQLKYQKDVNFLRYLILLRNAARKMKLQSAVQFIINEQMETKFDVTMEYLQAMEINAISRFVKDEDRTIQIGSIFKNLFMNENLDMKNFAIACQSLHEGILKIIDLEKFTKLNEKLEKANVDNDVEVNLALAMNYYSLFYLEKETLAKKFAKVKEDNEKTAIQTGVYSEIIEKLNLQEEIKVLSFLDRSIECFTNILVKIRADANERQKVSSWTRVYNIIANISMNYFYRGIEYKDIEAQNLLWNFITKDTNWSTVLSCCTTIIDSYDKVLNSSGSRMRLSGKVETVDVMEVLRKSRAVLSSEIEKFNSFNEAEQICILNNLLSLWQYYMLRGSVEEAHKYWTEFDNLWISSNLEKNPTYKHTFTAKVLFIKVQIDLSLRKRNPQNLMYNATRHILEVRSVSSEFTKVFHEIFYRLTIFAINFSINRMSDLDNYAKLMLTLKYQAITSGYFFLTAEYTSLSILRHLTMQKSKYVKVSKSKNIQILI